MITPQHRTSYTSTAARATVLRASVAALVTALAASVALTAGCSSRGLYEGSRPQRMQACERLPLNEQPECRRNADMPYHEYQRAREALDAE